MKHFTEHKVGQQKETPSEKHFRANAKLMISGEYLVLAGAKALAMPVGYHQSLIVKPAGNGSPQLRWRSFIQGSPWLDISFEGAHLEVKGAPSSKTENAVHFGYLRKVLMAARSLNPVFLAGNECWDAQSDISFNISWGLGSSSSLISNIADWAGVNPYALLFSISSGSGYDVACARSDTPILYTFKGRKQDPAVEAVHFNPPFSDQLYFVYRGKKQSSEQSLRDFRAEKVKPEDVALISGLSGNMASASNLKDFQEMIREHENLISAYIQQTPVKKMLFDEFPGEVKSLGAWGGDFMLAASAVAPEEIIAYFSQKGFGTVIPFRNMMIHKKNY